MSGGSQEVVDRYAKSLADDLPLRRADRLEQATMSGRQAEPRKPHDPIGTLGVGGAQLLAAERRQLRQRNCAAPFPSGGARCNTGPH